jgi:alkylation response protein AidB-like acyl-CoA dehydrogenase
MKFRFGPEEESFREEIIAFAKQELPANWWLSYQGEEYTGKNWEVTKKIAIKLGEKKWLGLRWPKQYGGLEASIFMELIFREEAAYWAIPGTVMGVGGTSWVGPCLLQFGTEDQKKRFLLPLARGEEYWCTGYSEPDSGSDLASLTTRARVMPDEYVVDGQKIWVSAAQIADWCWLLARTDPDAPKHKGLSLLMVDMKSPGITVRPIMTMTGSPSFNEVFFDNVHIPRKNLVGEENKGWEIMGKALNFERAWPPARAAGGIRRVLDELVRFITSKSIVPNPMKRLKIAELAASLEILRLFSYRVVCLIEKGITATHDASVAKLFGSELLGKAAEIGMDVLGPSGLLAAESPYAPVKGWIEHLYMTSPGLKLSAGSSEIQRNTIADRGLGLPRK